MKHLKVQWVGTTPLLMHDCKCVNPLHPIATKIKEITSKGKNKTEEDLRLLSDLEFQAGLYWNEQIGVYVPAENIEATICAGARSFRKGQDIQRHVFVTELKIPLDYGENLTLEQLMQNPDYRDVRAVRIKNNRLIRTRPRFERWRLDFVLEYNDVKIDPQIIIRAIDHAGTDVGLCDYRPKYGKFVANIEEIG